MGRVVVEHVSYRDAVLQLVVDGARQLQLLSPDHLVGQRDVHAERQIDRHLDGLGNTHACRRTKRCSYKDLTTKRLNNEERQRRRRNSPSLNMATAFSSQVVSECGRVLVMEAWPDLLTQNTQTLTLTHCAAAAPLLLAALIRHVAAINRSADRSTLQRYKRSGAT